MASSANSNWIFTTFFVVIPFGPDGFRVTFKLVREKKAIDYTVTRLMTWPVLFDSDNWNRTSEITNEVIQNLQKIENIKKNFYWMLLRDWKEQCDGVYWKHDLLEKDFIGDFFLAPYAESNCDSLF